ncbi:MAG: biopolymer transporter ExbD [Bacteroidetes bacterium]|nr:biopolymer transporter ExbD [Bacteroidota bacterium]MBS1974230.1 biopolymer transporter ExbD [Bacteroidota bacterium]
MAETDIASGRSRNRKNFRKSKKHPTKVDLTPMVDLGFLLITFFMVTTAWTKPHATKLNLPADGDSTVTGNDATLTLLAAKDNQVFYYNGALAYSLKNGLFGVTDYAIQSGVGKVIWQKQWRLDKNYTGGRKKLTVIIKISDEASYGNLVSILNEMLIHHVARYALVNITGEEKKLLREQVY